MLPRIRASHIKNIEFPVYVLPREDEDIEFVDGLLHYRGKVIDDRNMPGKTLGARRLQTPHKKLQFRRSCPTFSTMLKSNNLNFIDSHGNAFHYVKTKFVPLKYKRIQKIEKKEVASLLWAVGVETPFLIPRPPPAGSEWVGILYYHQYPWQIYDYSTQKLPNRRKKI